jgi:thiosulfate/3-mercaptopyruvate sulfurtransferase
MTPGKRGNYKGYADASLVSSVDDASKLVGKKDVIFIDTRNYWKYRKGHIPGAYNLELFAFHWIDTSREGVDAFVKQMRTLFESLGVGAGKKVVFYQNDSGYDAARGVWLLNYLGHQEASLLDGGLNLWKRKGLPVSTEDPDPLKVGSLTGKLDDSIIETLGSLSSRVQKERSGSLRVVDARSSGEFDGTFHRARKAGHIPGAINADWRLALRRDGTLKDAKQLRDLYPKLSTDATIVTYCQSGYRAAHSWLVLRLIGFEKVKNYLGSWYEWGNDPETQVAKI